MSAPDTLYDAITRAHAHTGKQVTVKVSRRGKVTVRVGMEDERIFPSMPPVEILCRAIKHAAIFAGPEKKTGPKEKR